jgi:hypothetical protein
LVLCRSISWTEVRTVKYYASSNQSAQWQKMLMTRRGGASTGPRTAEGKARIAAANYKHGRFVGWRAHREREKYYFAEIRRLMAEAKEAGLLEE